MAGAVRGSWRFSIVVAADTSPAPAAARQKLVRFIRPWASSRVDRWICRAILGPSVEHWLHHAPCVLHHVGAHEQRRVADHDVIEQRLVSDIRFFRKPVVIAELHLYSG